MYTSEAILQVVDQALNETPRKIPYETAIEWFQAQMPRNFTDHYTFLTEVFDENGRFKIEWIWYMLVQVPTQLLAVFV
jgi:hypothetical protein